MIVLLNHFTNGNTGLSLSLSLSLCPAALGESIDKRKQTERNKCFVFEIRDRRFGSRRIREWEREL